jgi:hypothetical protein
VIGDVNSGFCHVEFRALSSACGFRERRTSTLAEAAASVRGAVWRAADAMYPGSRV